MSDILSKKQFHLGLIVIGALFLCLSAFNTHYWFDESYTVALVRWSFADIWRIGSADVHPVLSYWLLHLVNLLFGENIIVYKLFNCLPLIALGAMGYTHIRKDYGVIAGLLFTAAVLFLPHCAHTATELRMYGWAALASGVCTIYALRIAKHTHQNAQTGEKKKAPLSWWALYAVFSLSCAYLHNYGMLTAFAINFVMLAYLLRHFKTSKADLGCFAASAVIQVALFMPWFFVVLAQTEGVVGDYWATFGFTKFAQMFTYPLVTTHTLTAALDGDGMNLKAPAYIAIACAAVVLLLVAFWTIKFVGKAVAQRGKQQDEAVPNYIIGLAITFNLFLMAMAFGLSIVTGTLLIVARYLFVGLPPLLIAIALMGQKVGTKVTLPAITCVFFVCAVCSQIIMCAHDYAPENDAPYDRYAQIAAELQKDDAPSGSQNIVSWTTIPSAPMSMVHPEIHQLYIGHYTGSSPDAFECYPDSFEARCSTDIADFMPLMDDTFMVLDASNGAGFGDEADSLLAKIIESFGYAEIVSEETFFVPYELHNFNLTVLKKI